MVKLLAGYDALKLKISFTDPDNIISDE